MDLDRSSYSDDSESFIPSSNFEPPPPVDCILQKSHTSVDETGINGLVIYINIFTFSLG